jgi:hypothetical protein
VNSTGYTAWAESPTSFPFAIRGVIVNDPEEMLDYAYNPDATDLNLMGGQFQVFIQGTGGDRGGTALWMAQNYQAMGMAGRITVRNGPTRCGGCSSTPTAASSARAT